jgi:hypothetical protein
VAQTSLFPLSIIREPSPTWAFGYTVKQVTLDEPDLLFTEVSDTEGSEETGSEEATAARVT